MGGMVKKKFVLKYFLDDSKCFIHYDPPPTSTAKHLEKNVMSAYTLKPLQNESI